jgi:hypothetical protein
MRHGQSVVSVNPQPFRQSVGRYAGWSSWTQNQGRWFPLAPAVLTNDGVAFRLRGELGCQGIDPFRGSHERQGKPVSLSSDRE